MRDGDWLLIERYDEEKTELYDLSLDRGEKQDLASVEPVRVLEMRAALDEWRRNHDVQHNPPNPDFDEDAFKKLYVDLDPSRFDPLLADEEEWGRMRAWREAMDDAIRKPEKET